MDLPIVQVFQIQNEIDLSHAIKKLYEFCLNRVRIYLKILLPVEQGSYVQANIFFNFHVQQDPSIKLFSALYPVNTLRDVIKVFFTIEEFELWSLILKSHALYSPPDHLLDHFAKAYKDYDLLNAFKTLTLVHSFNENN